MDEKIIMRTSTKSAKPIDRVTSFIGAIASISVSDNMEKPTITDNFQMASKANKPAVIPPTIPTNKNPTEIIPYLLNSASSSNF